MSGYHQIFLAADKPEEQLISEIAAAAGCELTPVDSPQSDIAYAGEVDRTAVEIELSHEFEDDMGIQFSRYRTVVTVRSYDNDKEREESVARAIFENLRKSHDYPMALVFDLSLLLATNERR